MRVGIVCPYSLDVPGGVQSHVLGLADALHRLGHGVDIIAPGTRAQDAGIIAPARLTQTGRSTKVPYNGSVAHVSFGPHAASQMRAWLRAGCYDVVHVHEPIAPSLSAMALAFVGAAPAVVGTFHVSTDKRHAMRLAGVAGRGPLARLDARVAVSPAAADTAAAYLSAPMSIIPNGLQLRDFAGTRNPEPGSVLFLGRVDEPRKGLRELLHVWPHVRARRPQATLRVAGPGHWHGSLPDGVELKGRVDDTERLRLLKSSEIFVAPHTGGESFGIVLAEALAAGVPVVARALPAFEHVLRPAVHSASEGSLVGLLADQHSMADTIADLLADVSTREKLSFAGLQAVKPFDWPVVARDIEGVYVDALARRAAGPDTTTGPRKVPGVDVAEHVKFVI